MSSVALAVVRRFLDVAVDALAVARTEIDALNVYPVPDGDTGTNLFLTMASARDGMQGAGGEADLDTALAALARGALLGARGNSGVILSEMLGEVTRRIASAQPDERNAAVLADAFERASAASYAAVGRPVEGTMLTVARRAAEAASARLAQPVTDHGPDSAGARSRDVLFAAAAAAREALAHTPEQLAALRDAGVVDAGGRGICVILDAAERALTGRVPAPTPASGSTSTTPAFPTQVTGDLVPGGPAYEVMYLLDAADDRVPALRQTLDGLGDSLVVVGGDGLWNVHVHVDDVGAAVEAGIAAGRPHRIRITHFADSHPDSTPRSASPQARNGRTVVAVAAGPGLAQLFTDAGAVVVAPPPGSRPSTGEILQAVLDSGGAEVVVLPNDPDSLRVAQVAASTAQADAARTNEQLRVVVVATTAQVEGLAALAVHAPERELDQDVLAMTATARHTRQGAVTVAARAAMTMAGPCEPGDVLGVIAGDFVLVGDTPLDVATEVLRRLLGAGGELVTVVAGADPGSRELADSAAAWVEAHHPAVDVVVYDGGQERYPLLVSVE